MSSKHDFPSWLRHARAASDLTQETLAEAVGCATQTVRAFESGRRRPSREMAARLADILQLPLAERDDFMRLARTPIAKPAPDPTPAISAAPALMPIAPQRPALTLPADALIGRREDLERVSQALLDHGERLITVLGSGGIGKTRLALQSAADLAAHFADGAAFVALASVTDTANVVTTIAEAIGYVLPGVQSPEAELLAYLRERAMLLVLDNLEHLLAPQHGDQIGLLLANLVHDAPNLRLLITSRERLRLRSEVVIELEGLALPSDNRASMIDRSDAVLLFLERARQVLAGFTLTPERREAVARICRLLGGAPLGIELAATWVRVLSCEEIASEVARSVDFLAHTNRDILPRHRSLRAVMDYSWQLLTADEQRLLAHLSVFSAGCEREAIAAVLPASESAASTQRTVLPLLAALADKSLLRRIAGPTGATRYDLHELVRQYAAMRMAENSAVQMATQAQHAAYYADWLARQEPILKSAQQKVALQAITVEIDNLRAAWRWGCAERDTALLRQMTLALHWFCEVRGWHAEAATMFAQACTVIRPLAEAVNAPATVQANYWLLVSFDGWYALRRDPVYPLARLQAAMDAQRQLDDPQARLNCAYGLGYLKIFLGDYADAQLLLEEARDIAITIDDRWGLSVALVVRGILETLRSDAVTARWHLDAALIAARAVGDPRHISLALNYFGITALNLGQFDQAERACRECMTIAAGNQDRYQIGLVLQSLGRVALSRAEYTECEWLLNEGLATARMIGDRWLEAQALGCLGALAVALGKLDRARKLHRAAVATAVAAPLPIALNELAALAILELDAQPEAALATLAYIRQHPLARPSARAEAEQRWLSAQQLLPAEQLLAIEERARTFAPEQPTALLALFG